MKKYKSILIVANLLVLLVLFHSSVWQKETILEDGKMLYFELAPVDPRSLMQGDYMRLSYAISRRLQPKKKRGYCIVQTDNNGIAKLVRLQTKVLPLKEGEYAIRFNKKDWQTTVGADSFFFEEGQARKYGKAKYGLVKVDKKGHDILVGLADKELKEIK
jgi:uncharacterized membrane-anchored protein|tara:strand:- start:2651 stop:3130 length:480 start_codon:yes stop_codon:yes gene_type:complete